MGFAFPEQDSSARRWSRVRRTSSVMPLPRDERYNRLRVRHPR
ncbi:hypothetical protein ACW2Q0_11220 [Nocardia sp. R16R-3T]